MFDESIVEKIAEAALEGDLEELLKKEFEDYDYEIIERNGWDEESVRKVVFLKKYEHGTYFTDYLIVIEICYSVPRVSVTIFDKFSSEPSHYEFEF